MNGCNQRFLEKNEISIEEVCSNVDCKIYSRMDVNPIVASYNFQKEREQQMISIADVVGYDADFEGNYNVFSSLDHFFDENGGGYATRSLGMLELDKDNIIENLKQSFFREPMVLMETGENSYTISTNGLHRYTMLRLFYLNEASKVRGNQEELEKLKEKYTIPASVVGMDLEKTYCKYILKRAEFEGFDWQVTDVNTEYNSDYEVTGNVVIRYGNGQTEVLTHEQLMSMTRERILEDDNFKNNYPELQNMYNKYPSFEKFIDENFLDIVPLQKQHFNERGER